MASGLRDAASRVKIFISYSRKDMAFADRLEPALKARGFEVLIDRGEIFAFEDWWKRIEALIGSADTVVFVLSPDAIASGVALKEVAYAASLNKRFAPIVYRPVEDSAAPEALRRLNFIFFDDPKRFDESAGRLADALETDISWIRQHTEYGESERRWAASGRPNGLLLQSPILDLAEHWLVSRPRNAPEVTKEIQSYVVASRKRARTSQQVRRLTQTSIFTLLIGIILILVGLINQEYLIAEWRWYTVTLPYARKQVWPYVLSAANEHALKPGQSFKECAQACPEMIVVPPGSFAMGGTMDISKPVHTVTIAKPLAISKYQLTFADWDACVSAGGCDGYRPDDQGWGRGQQPIIDVNWADAQQYVTWLSQVTGRIYRLLSEAEYEYATRAGTTTEFPLGDDVDMFLPPNSTGAVANCDGCGSKWDGSQTAPVGSFSPNKFGLYDMPGNVFEWTEDCAHKNYNGAPTDGSPWIAEGVCSSRIVRGAGWDGSGAMYLRSESRIINSAFARNYDMGFRVARTLDAR
jgi:formylglycine-generating enzyme required for sulfatase activity